ncbi:hypothetical protein GCM10007886_49210 [Methylobacterium gregans]|nr:hypothetical protein GCM10007886_49210 [Methylobacterium gregans]
MRAASWPAPRAPSSAIPSPETRLRAAIRRQGLRSAMAYLALITAALALGTGIAQAAMRRPLSAERLEMAAGTLLLTGLALLGTGLPLFR